MAALETDYRSIAVAEIVFIDQPRDTVRVLRRRDDGTGEYDEQILTDGTLALSAVPGFSLSVADLWTDPRPTPLTVLAALLTP